MLYKSGSPRHSFEGDEQQKGASTMSNAYDHYDDADHYEGDGLDLYSLRDGDELMVAIEMLCGDGDDGPMVVGMYLTVEEAINIRDTMTRFIEEMKQKRMH
jgi:hypothetical protein